MKPFSRLEQETVIVFNAEEKTASVTTFDPRMLRKLDKLVERAPDAYKVEDVFESNGEIYGKTYNTKKKLISLRVPRPTREMTPEQRQAAAERLAKVRRK